MKLKKYATEVFRTEPSGGHGLPVRLPNARFDAFFLQGGAPTDSGPHPDRCVVPADAPVAGGGR